MASPRSSPGRSRLETFNQAAVRIPPAAGQPPEGTYSLILYSKVGMPDASHAYNPWLHELPDPISKVTWDNYACLSPTAAGRLGVSDGDVVRLETVGWGRTVRRSGTAGVCAARAARSSGGRGPGLWQPAQQTLCQHRTALAPGQAHRGARRPGRKKCRSLAELGAMAACASLGTACA